MSPTPVRLTIVSPCYNEREIIGRFIEAVLRTADELRDTCETRLLIVDDGSGDGSVEELAAWGRRDSRVAWISLARNFGHQAALSAGIEHAAPGAVLTMDSDMEHPPELIPELVRHWLAGADVVSAVRRDPEGLPWFKNASSNLFYTVFNLLSDTKLQRGAADFVLLSAKARGALQSLPEHHRFLRALVSWTGFPRAFVPYDQPVRPAGKSKYTARRMLRLALHGVLSFSARPIYWMFGVSLALLAAGFVYLLYVLWVSLVLGHTVPGWASMLGVMLVLGGWLTFSISVIGLYIARIFEQVKGRPVYVISRRSEAPTPPAGG
jgi:polyisoprenyl-phosphate glycosyltransferase